MNLQFHVVRQTMKRTDGNAPVADSVKYLSAEFIFDSSDWDNTTKTATFRNGDDVYTVILDVNGSCLVPWEIITAGRLKVSVYGDGANDYRITADTVDVPIFASGYSEGEESQQPTPTQYEQLTGALAGKVDKGGLKTINGQSLEGEGNITTLQIDDAVASTSSAYSSEKVTQLINTKPSIDDTEASETSVYSSDKTAELIGAKPSINDTTATTTSVYSSEKTVQLVSAKPSINDAVASTASVYSSNKVETLLTGLTPVVANPALSGSETKLKGLEIGSTKYALFHNGFVNVKDFGAVGDGTTEDTTAMVNAFNYVATNGKILYIPEGTYLVQWGQIKPFISENGMAIVGDGRFKSIIRFMENHNSGQFGNGVIIQHTYSAVTKPNFAISDVGFYYDDNDAVLDPDNQSRQLGLYGQYGKVIVENCYFHLGGTAENKPADSNLWLNIGADFVSVKNCLFENFTNNIHGGAIWISPVMVDQTTTYNYEIDTVVIENNEFKTSNSDEALGLFPKMDNPTPGQCFNHIFISNNVFIHKNWLDTEGDVKTTYGIVTVFVNDSRAPVVNADIVISNNYIESALAYQELIRVVGFTGVDVSNNHLVLKAHSLPSTTSQYSLLLFDRDTKGVVKDNYFDYTAITCEIRLFLNKTAEATWTGNIIKTGGKFALNPSGDDSASLGSKLSFVNNTVYVPTNYYIILRKGFINSLLLLTNNTIYGGLVMGNIYGTGFIVRGNHFNANSTTTSVVDVKTSVNKPNATFDFQGNDGVTLNLDTANIPSASKIANFKYTGKKSNIVFKVEGTEVADSAETRALLFASTANTDIAYFGE